MIRYKAAALALGAGALCSLRVAALGIGEIRLESYLNEPFRASIVLLDTSGIDERQLRIRLASRDDFDRVGAERAYFLTGLTFEVELSEEGGGRVIVTSKDPVLEPYLNFLIEARWPDGRLLREFTVLLDPPTYTPAVAGRGASARAIAQAPEMPVVERTERTDVASEPLTLPSGSVAGSGAPVTERPFAKDTAPAPAGGERYLIRSGETLWSIARNIQSDPEKMRDTMLDIQRRNPDAFIAGNINQIKAGFIIYLPRPDEIGQAPDEAVVADLQRQNAVRQAQAAAAQTTDAALRIAPTEERDVPAAQSTARAEAAAAAAPAEPTSAELDNVAERLATLESRMGDLLQLIELKDQQIAALQQALADKEREQPPSQPADPAAASGTPAAAAVVPPPAVVPAPPAQSPQPFWLERLPIIGLGTGILLLALLAAMRWRRKQQKADSGRRKTDGRFDGVTLGGAGVVVGRADAGSMNTTSVAETASELAAAKNREQAFNPDMSAVDALAEADIYIAYGRYPQAKDLLRRAVSASPLDTALRLKLLEVSAETLDQAEFCQQYADLLALGDGEAIAQAGRIAESFADGEAWCAALPETSLSEEQLVQVQQASAEASEWPVEPDVEDGLDDFENLDDNPFLRKLGNEETDAGEGFEPAGELGADTEQGLQGDVNPEHLSSLALPEIAEDVELSAPEPAPAPTDADDAASREARSAGEDMPLVLDLSADLGEPLNDRFDDLSIDDEQDGYDLDLSLDPLADMEAVASDLDVEASSNEGASLTDSDAMAATSPAASEISTLEDDELTEGLAKPADEELSSLAALDIADDELTPTDALLNADDDHAVDDEPIFAVGGDEAAAKLDLARAFIDIGEQEGARQLLQEVLSEGGSEHQAEAESLLEQLG